MLFIKETIITFPTIETMVLITVIAGGDKMPELKTNRAKLLSGMVTGETFLLELTGTILGIWELLLKHQEFLPQVDRLPNILLEIPDR